MDTQNPALHYLNTPDGHSLPYACYGTPDKIPLVFLHGGPGSSCHPGDARLFDPARYYLIQFDQRGCGLATPTGSVHNNTTAHLIADMEQVRAHLGIESWLVYGGSWGATLALEYAKQHTQRVRGLVLRGSFLGRQEDLDWFVHPEGAARELPEAYQTLCAHLPAETNESLTSCLYRILLQAQAESALSGQTLPEVAYCAAHAMSSWNAALMRIPPPAQENSTAQQLARIHRELVFSHYCHHGFFLPKDGVLTGIEGLRHLPITAVHGRQDRVCRPEGAHVLRSHLPQLQLIEVDAGHGLHETAIWTALSKVLVDFVV